MNVGTLGYYGSQAVGYCSFPLVDVVVSKSLVVRSVLVHFFCVTRICSWLSWDCLVTDFCVFFGFSHPYILPQPKSYAGHGSSFTKKTLATGQLQLAGRF